MAKTVDASIEMNRRLQLLIVMSFVWYAGVAELVDARDSKSRSFGVSVRFRPPVPPQYFPYRFDCVLFLDRASLRHAGGR